MTPTTNTHTFLLTTGVECEIKEFDGKHQEILTRTTANEKFSDKLNKVLIDLIVRVGSKKDIDLEFVSETMMDADRRMILVEARQFAMEFEESFDFTFKYLDADNKPQEDVQHITLPKIERLVKAAVKKEGDEDGEAKVATYHTFPIEPFKKQYKEYSEIEKNVTITLPRSKQEIRYTMLDGEGVAIGMGSKKTERSSHTSIKMRRPVYFHQGKTEKVPVALDLNTLALKDIEFLRKSIKENEGRVHTEWRFEHPNAENIANPKEREVVIDLVNEPAFFFPSEAI